MDRLIKKWNTAKTMVPTPQLYQEKSTKTNGVVFFGTSQYAAEEAIELLKAEGIEMDALRIKSFPFNQTVVDFVNDHQHVFVIEQNRDAQMRSLMMIEFSANPTKLVSVLNYDGMPITADNILKQCLKNYYLARKKPQLK